MQECGLKTTLSSLCNLALLINTGLCLKQVIGLPIKTKSVQIKPIKKCPFLYLLVLVLEPSALVKDSDGNVNELKQW